MHVASTVPIRSLQRWPPSLRVPCVTSRSITTKREDQIPRRLQPLRNFLRGPLLTLMDDPEQRLQGQEQPRPVEDVGNGRQRGQELGIVSRRNFCS